MLRLTLCAPHTSRDARFLAIAYTGQALEEESVEAEWILMMKPGTTDAEIKSLCTAYIKGCEISGHPDTGGVPFLDLRATQKELRAVIEAAHGSVQFVEPQQTLHMIPELDVQPGSARSWGLDRVGAGRSGSNED